VQSFDDNRGKSRSTRGIASPWHWAASKRRSPVPADAAQQGAEELAPLLIHERLRIGPKYKPTDAVWRMSAPPLPTLALDGHPCFQHRSLSARRKRATNQRESRKAAFVDQTMWHAAPHFFYSWPILAQPSAALRSSARALGSGFCGCIRRSASHYEIAGVKPDSPLAVMTRATRAAVQSSVGNRNSWANGETSPRLAFSGAVSLRGRPEGCVPAKRRRPAT